MRVTSYVEIVLLPDDTLRCPATWDGVACWPSSHPDHVITQACPSFYEEPELDWVSRKYAINYFAFMYMDIYICLVFPSNGASFGVSLFK